MRQKLCLLLSLEKRTYNGLPDLMTKVAEEEMNRMDDDIAECKVVYMPQVITSVIFLHPLTPSRHPSTSGIRHPPTYSCIELQRQEVMSVLCRRYSLFVCLTVTKELICHFCP